MALKKKLLPILGVVVVLLLLTNPFPKPKLLLILLRDVSASSKNNTILSDATTSLCKAILEPAQGSQFALVKYADYSQPSNPQIIKDSLLFTPKCEDTVFQPMGTGTNLKAAVEDALFLIKQTSPDVIPVTLLIVHADENGSKVKTTRTELAAAMTELAKMTETRHGKLIIIAGSYHGLQRYLWDNTSGLSTINLQTIQFCELQAQQPQSTSRCVKNAVSSVNQNQIDVRKISTAFLPW